MLVLSLNILDVDSVVGVGIGYCGSTASLQCV